MLDQFTESEDALRRLRSGVLGAHLDSFADHLAKCGYAATTARSHLTVLGNFNQWMTRRRTELGELNDELVDRFVHDRTRRRKLRRGDSATAHQFLTHLRAHGVIPSPIPVIDETPLGMLERQYEEYLVLERGLAPATVTNYCGFLRGFLLERYPCDTHADPPGNKFTVQS